MVLAPVLGIVIKSQVAVTVIVPPVLGAVVRARESVTRAPRNVWAHVFDEINLPILA
jgi:hypothetical protein